MPVARAMMIDAALQDERSFGLGRFRVSSQADGCLRFDDRLRRGARFLPASSFDQLPPAQRDIELIRKGFADAAYGPLLRSVGDRPTDPGDLFFWQFPCRTEAEAWVLHAGDEVAPYDGEDVHVYVGLPWATWLDKRRVDPEQATARQELALLRTRLSGLRDALKAAGAGLRVHTVCQHVYWRDFLVLWRELGITDLWLSHLLEGDEGRDGEALRLHAWRLFAVNAEDAARSAGLSIGRDPATKRYLASFIGAHADHYLSPIRKQLECFVAEPGFVVEVGEGWHFEQVVYAHQIAGRPMPQADAATRSVERYNQVLSDSVFSLCPAGAGPNTLRLWESLAVGSVPVLLGPRPALPKHGALEGVDWSAIVVEVDDASLHQLPALLHRMPMDVVRTRQRLGMRAFEMATRQRCFSRALPTTRPHGA